VTHSYRDPLSEVWLSAAMKIGLRVSRSNDAFAHSDGAGGLEIAHADQLDEDDCLAQMIFHELCHSLVEGPESFDKPDWGLNNQSDEDNEREHATLRVQALLAGRYGLRALLGPTTNFRHFYDELSPDPLLPRQSESSCLARLAIRRSATNPWWPHLGKALEATADIARTAAKWPAPSGSPSLYRLVAAPLPVHASGLHARLGDKASEDSCAGCAWRQDSGHCHQADRVVAADEPSCERYEPPFDCLDCGACCRSAYHSVTISEGDLITERHPGLLVHHESYSEVRRDGDHCGALDSSTGKHLCTIYEDRPTCCREFANAGHNCITARRRLGFSL